MLEKYFQAELSYLREAARAFADQHPSMAGLLAERGGDPKIGRLLEGFAFVAARLRQRTNHAVPELLDGLTELLLPPFLRPTPASTIIEFRTLPGAHRAQQRVVAGTSVLSRPVQGTVCPFRTTRPLDLAPLDLVAQHLDDSSASRPELTLQFRAQVGGNASVFRAKGLRLYLHGDLPTATQLYLWFARHVSSVTVRTEDGRSVELSSHAVELVGFDAADPLFPWPSFSPQGLRLLLEYFALPPKFLFIDILGLEKAAHLESTSFELSFRFARPPALPSRLGTDALRLHCVPSINLFDIGATVVRTTANGRAMVLRPTALGLLQAEVFEVRSMIGTRKGRPEQRSYEPSRSFRRPFGPVRQRHFYELKREISPTDDGIETSLQIEPSPDLTETDEETLTIDLTCTSRSIPNELKVGDVGVPTNDMPPGMKCMNISAVARPTRPQLGSEEGFHFLAHLSASQRSLADVAVLKTFLSLYNFQERSDHQQGRANRARIEAIQSVSSKTVTRVVTGATLRGSLFRIEVEQASFASEGDAFLFGSVLHRLLGDQTGVHSFVDLELILMPSEVSFRWKAVVE